MQNEKSKFQKKQIKDTLPSYEIFKRSNVVQLTYNQNNITKKGSDNPDISTLFLKDQCMYYIRFFDDICEKVINSKFQSNFEEICNFGDEMMLYDGAFMLSIILNTDQNSEKFFQLFAKFVKEKVGKDIQGKIVQLSDSNFYDLKNLLFKTLNLRDNPNYDGEIKVNYFVIIIVALYYREGDR